MSYLEQLLKFLTSSYGLIGVFLCLFILAQANEAHRRQHWFLLTLCGFAASLGEYRDQWIKQAPVLAFPLEQLRDAGRPLAVFLLGLLLFIAFKTPKNWRSVITPKPVIYLTIVQLVILLKSLQFGSIAFAFLSVTTFGTLVLMISQGPSRWLQDERNFQLAVWSIAMVGILFAIANLYQASIDVYPITFVHGLFLGTTGNPQHAATLLVATIPCFLFLLQQPRQSWLIKWFWMAFLGLIVFGLIWTGSRTGTLSAIVAILLFYRYRGGQFLRWVLVFAIILVIIVSFMPNDLGLFDLGSSLNKLSSQSNTREDVWEAQWEAFMNYPIFGQPFTGDRLRYGESSWLAAGAALGLLGFVPLVLFGLESVKMIRKLDRFAIKCPDYYLHCSVVIAGLVSLLLGSFTEAYLLANITFSLLAILLYQVMGTYLLELERKGWRHGVGFNRGSSTSIYE